MEGKNIYLSHFLKEDFKGSLYVTPEPTSKYSLLWFQTLMKETVKGQLKVPLKTSVYSVKEDGQ